MLQIIDNALNTVRMDPDHGELMYQVLYFTYFSKKKPANREVILGCDMSTFLRYFPAAETLYEIFVAIGVGFILLNLVWQLFRNFGLGLGLSAEDPVKLAIKSILFIFLALFADQIMVLVLGIVGTPYDWVVDTALPPIEFASFASVVTVLVGSLVSGSVSLIVLILVLIVFNHHSSSNSTHTNAQAAGAAFTGGGNGLVGVTKRAAGNAAAASATGNAKGLSNLVGGAMFESSLQNGGKFAMSVVGAVAKGSISSVGSITGDQAAEALTSYLGYSPVDSGSALADDGGLIPPSPITSEDVVTLDGGTAAGTASPTASANGTPISSGAREHDGSVVESARISGAPPIFQNVEIGGGRITGLEVSPDRQSDREFAMYSTEQYMAPTGPYDTVQTVDGASWYRQYAQPKVEKTPYTDEGDKIRYEERIVSQMPPVPKRKDKI